MVKKNEAKVKISGNVEELKQSFDEAQKHFQTLRSEASLIEAQFKNTGDKAKYLEDKHKNLSAQIEENAKKQESLRAQLELAIQAEDSAQVEKLTAQFNRQEMQGENLARQMRELNNEIEYEKSVFGKLSNEINTQENELRSLKNEYSNAVLQYGKNSDEAKNLSHQIENLSQSLSENKEELENVRRSADEFDESIEKINSSAESASNGGFTVMKGAVSSLVADGIKTAAGSMKDFVVETDKANSVFQAQTGASAEEMDAFNQAMINIYSNNFGENMLDIADSMAQVKQQTRETDPSKIQELTEHAILLRDTFDMDIQESMRAVNMLMNQFGISGTEAFNLIVQGAQNGLDKNGDLLDSINEYSVHYKQQGYSAEQFFNSLLNGTEAGTFSVDKLGDAMKEFGIRTKDTADSTTEGFELIGLNADYMRAEFAKGGEAAQQATEKTLSALFSLDDQVKQNQAGVDLFGTMWEDLGVDGVQALMNTQGAIDLNIDSLSQLNEVRYDNLTDFMASIGRELESNLMPLINEVFPLIQDNIQAPLEGLVSFSSETIIPMLSDSLTWMNEHQNTMIAIAGIIGTIIGILTIYNLLKTVGIALDAAEVTSLGGLIAAKWAENAANIAVAASGMAALAPLLLIVAAIAAVIAIIIVCIKHWDDIKTAVGRATDFMGLKIEQFKNFVSTKFDAVKNKISSVSYAVKSIVISVINSIIEGVEGGVNRVIRGINTIINGFNKIIGAGGKVLGIDIAIPTINTISLPRVALAEGGIAFSPIQALIGEGDEPEAVAPVSVLKSYIEESVESALKVDYIIDYTRLAEAMAAMSTIIELNDREIGRVVRS